jgi:SHS2 domain-containing protein
MDIMEAGFEELPHTADWAVRVWAGSLPELFEEAALAMNALSGVKQAPCPRRRRTLKAEASDMESLLVAFLSDLVYFAEHEKLAFDIFKVDIQNNKLKVTMSGSPIQSMSKSIKAVTYHNLQIRKTEHGFQTEIVLDV